jgi:hypothetical protein
MAAFFRATFEEFLRSNESEIVGCLTRSAAKAGFHQQLHTQTEAWSAQVGFLKQSMRDLATQADCGSWNLLLEYAIPRRAKRIDLVVLAGEVIFVVEFKWGAASFSRDGIRQVEDYALDLRDFHRESLGHPIVPVLVATNASDVFEIRGQIDDPVKQTLLLNCETFSRRIEAAFRQYGPVTSKAIQPETWDASEYAPTPTIIEAAQSLYAGQSVREISRCHAGAENLTRTSAAVLDAIRRAQVAQKKVLCLVTGVPGAGKTLAGLNIVHSKELHHDGLGVFLSGNGPLVRVLTEALARDNSRRTTHKIGESRRQVTTFVQNVHRFVDQYFAHSEHVPVDHVVVFDEAQRAWDADQSRRKFNRDYSEPEMMLSIMDRHKDWAVIVALIGGGQEINQGEAGLPEWGRALNSRFQHWNVFMSRDLKSGVANFDQCLFSIVPENMTIEEDPALHLSVALRSYRAERLADFVDALLEQDVAQARALRAEIGGYPLALTRELKNVRNWLRQRQRGTRRIGLVASSGGRRLLAEGLDVRRDLDVENWFLNAPEDVRSSFSLETPATEFGIQGLELDWTGLCWDSDLIPDEGKWLCRTFKGAQWQNVHDARRRRYVVNKYRVLMTRAREGMIVYVPRGDQMDPTRSPAHYQKIADFLHECGIQEQHCFPK